MKHILLILLENEPGSLSRVVGLFSQRGYNIESITVSPTEDASISSVTIQTNGDTKTIEQIEKQLHKLINVLKVTPINQKNYIEREIALIKIKNSGYALEQTKIIIDTFNGRIIDIIPNIYTIEITGSSKKINIFLNIINKISKIIEISRSGIIGITRESEVF
ncbi:acetolactate synthase small subunit [Buchnera aphidicola]|uniref:Acetolactate synthase small subunit n=1 Tax=Buchnera aphidicola (Sarucallis kahawaluokalani) TaxID=1241878 RepID=A0A4D6YCS6_9GAMM|nr:acetolactate synthase small subunit [Buchnera aphidicola]QCI25953.1 acetolactate synthase small subunit [Buchnera aphidicola (Sarucallis kahawaluokalani)]